MKIASILFVACATGVAARGNRGNCDGYRAVVAPALVVIALVETAGIWIPVLAVPWAVLPTRIAAAGYITGAAVQGALVHYQPFDVEIALDGSVLPNHPSYEAALVFALMFAAVPFAMGLSRKRPQRRIVTTRNGPT